MIELKDKILSRFFIRVSRKCPNWMNTEDLALVDGSHSSLYVQLGHSRNVILYCHGNGEHMSDCFLYLNRILDHGIGLASFEYPGIANSELPTVSRCKLAALCAFDSLVSKYGISPTDIFLMGYSLGTGVALEVASQKRIGGLILNAPFSSASDMIKLHSFDLLFSCCEKLLLIEDVFNNIECAKRVSCPSLVFHGKDDRTVPIEQGMRVFDSLRSYDKKMFALSSVGHCDIFSSKEIQYIYTVAKFINRER